MPGADSTAPGGTECSTASNSMVWRGGRKSAEQQKASIGNCALVSLNLCLGATPRHWLWAAHWWFPHLNTGRGTDARGASWLSGEKISQELTTSCKKKMLLMSLLALSSS